MLAGCEPAGEVLGARSGEPCSRKQSDEHHQERGHDR